MSKKNANICMKNSIEWDFIILFKMKKNTHIRKTAFDNWP